MIFGVVSFEEDLNCSELFLKNIINLNAWDNSVRKEKEWKGFKGAFLTDKNLPFTAEDFVYCDPDSGIMVFMDGVIYNQEEICLQLNIKPDNLSVPHLVCKAFIKWGASYVERLNGDFAICIYNWNANEVYLFRDHLGIRPLAYSRVGSCLYFSTDIMGLCKTLFSNEKIETDFLLNYFLNGSFDYLKLPTNKTKILKSGHYINISPEKYHLSRYWKPEKIDKDNTLNLNKVVEDLDILLKDSVKIRSDKRFFASAHVSGGIDSGIVAALARQEFSDQNEFYGISWTPDKEINKEEANVAYDERLLVKKICSMNKMPPLFIDYEVKDHLNYVNDWRHKPYIVREKKVQEALNRKKINLIFGGWGGDEFISIGHRGIDADLIREFDWVYFFKKYSPLQPKKFLSAFIKALFPYLRKPYTYYKSDPGTYPYIKKILGSNIIPRNERFPLHSRREVHLKLIESGHLAQRNYDWHVIGRPNGIEYRYPLLDKRVVEYMLKVPSRCLVGGNNYRILLRLIGKEILPHEVLANKSKDDPVKSFFNTDLFYALKKQMINEFHEYRNNPDLTFVDLDLLEKNLPYMDISKNCKSKKCDPFVLEGVIATHIFTKGYYN